MSFTDKVVLKEGTGATPQRGFTTKIHFRASLENGSEFDTTDNHGPLTFCVGKSEILPGLEAIVMSMKQGEVCTAKVEPAFAYGAEGSPPSVPENATIKFEVELLDVCNSKDFVGDGSLVKTVVNSGSEGWETPSYESKCIVHLKCYSADATYLNTFDQRPLLITLGVEGLEYCLASMTKTEKAMLSVKAACSYGPTGRKHTLKLQGSDGMGASDCIDVTIPANVDLLIDIFLVDFQKEKLGWELVGFLEKNEQALLRKNDGNEFFSRGNYRAAIRKYKKAIEIFNFTTEFTPEEVTESEKVKFTCWLNTSACYLKLASWRDAVTAATKALEIDSNSAKGLWRRSNALVELGELERAYKDIKEAYRLAPGDTQVRSTYAKLQKMLQEQQKKEKTTFQSVFERL